MNLNEQQLLALKVLNSGENLFLTGGAGTGKTAVIREFLKNTAQKAVVCAPTGIAAVNINGDTIHKVFQLPCSPIGPNVSPRAENPILDLSDIVIIDEISMCRFDVFRFIVRSIQESEMRSGHRIQLVVVGDFYQLPPVINPRTDQAALRRLWGSEIGRGFAFQTAYWEACQFKCIELTEIMRQQDQDFSRQLNRLRIGDLTCLDYFNKLHTREKSDSITLCPTKKMARAINEKVTMQKQEQGQLFTALEEGVFDISLKMVPNKLLLKEGMNVIALTNDPAGQYQNGTLGVIEYLTNSRAGVIFDNGHECEIGYNTWNNYEYTVDDEKNLVMEKIGSYSQIPLMPSYAMTIHKSQGQTYDRVNVVPTCFAPGQLYVALSRVRSSSGLHLANRISADNVIVAKEVKRFYSRVTMLA